MIFRLFIGMLSLLFLMEPICGLNNKLSSPPFDKIDDMDISELEPEEIINFNDYSQKDFKEQAEDGLWSTIWHRNLSYLKTSLEASSTLKGYSVNNLLDKKVETTWVEGTKGDGLKEWISIKLDADKHSPSSTPFTIHWVGIIPGYAKSQKTWEENNRVKSALLIIFSPGAPRWQYVICRLKFKDVNGLQVFHLSNDLAAPNMDPMTKTLWLVIEDVYKGTKFADTCISEVVVRGGCLP